MYIPGVYISKSSDKGYKWKVGRKTMINFIKWCLNYNQNKKK